MLEEKIEQFRQYIIHDLEKAVEGEANYLAALGLAVYTEFLGGLYRCTHDYGNAKSNYNEGLGKLGNEYEELYNSQGDAMYYRVRCGLVHEYLIKDTAKVSMSERSPNNCGMVIENNNTICFYVIPYLEDFKQAMEEYINEMRTNESLKNYFLRGWRVASEQTRADGTSFITPQRNVSSE